MDFLTEVAGALAPGGPISHSLGTFRTREGQSQMAVEVARTMETGGVLVVEAGTGIGKTFAYLIPALLGGGRVLVSTATKALQDQLFKRDIPKLTEALGISPRVAMLKGRGSYVCLDRIANRQATSAYDGPDIFRQWAKVEVWVQSTQTGDLAELDHLDENSLVIPLITSTRESCRGHECKFAQGCHVYRARREALEADLVVVNHHLFFADLNIRESGVAELLPAVRTVVFDEAHQLNEIGVQFLGHQLSTVQLKAFSNDLLKVSQVQARGYAPWPELMGALAQSTQDLRAMAGTDSRKMQWSAAVPTGMEGTGWTSTLNRIGEVLGFVKDALLLVEAVSPELKALRERAQHLCGTLEMFRGEVARGYVRWLDTGKHLQMVYSPLDIARDMQARVLAGYSGSTEKSWIFTSATLGHDDALDWFLRNCGLEGARVMQVRSPFNYEVQAAIYIPQSFPHPRDPSHSLEVAHLVAQGATVLRGRTLVLTTSLRAMRSIGQALRDYFDQAGNLQMQILVQGDVSKRELIERFGGFSPGTQPQCILVASASFWEGIDFPRDALQLLVIDKLPFAPLDDPLHQARTRELEHARKNSFAELQLPQAAIALRQGVGRLIRRETDRGILVVCDPRLTQMAYGKKLLRSLPAMRQLDNRDQWLEALQALTIPSTMDPYSSSRL